MSLQEVRLGVQVRSLWSSESENSSPLNVVRPATPAGRVGARIEPHCAIRAIDSVADRDPGSGAATKRAPAAASASRDSDAGVTRSPKGRRRRSPKERLRLGRNANGVLNLSPRALWAKTLGPGVPNEPPLTGSSETRRQPYEDAPTVNVRTRFLTRIWHCRHRDWPTAVRRRR